MSVLRTLLALLTILAGPALAQPVYVDISGIDPGDTLNIRAKPSGQAEIIGAFPHDAKMIEITPARNGWARVIWQESNGWIASRFTTPTEVAFTDGMPRGLSCSGTEPFWSLRLNDTSAIYSTPEGPPVPVDLNQPIDATGRLWPKSRIFTGVDRVIISTIRPLECSDGMSDRDYPWTLDILLQSPAGRELRTGCCYLPYDIGDN